MATPRSRVRRTAILPLALVTMAWCGAAPAPITDLFRSPLVDNVRLSPNGKYFAAISADEAGTSGLIVYDIEADRPTGVRGGGEFDVYSYRWLGDDQLLYSISREKIYSFGLYVVPRDHLSSGVPLMRYDVVRVIAIPEKRPNRAWVWVVQSAAKQGQPGDLVEIATDVAGKSPLDRMPVDAITRVVPQPPGAVFAWLPTRDGELGLCFTYADGHQHAYRYGVPNPGWNELAFDPEAYRPIALDPDGRSVWVVTHSAEQGYALQRYDLNSGAVESPVVTDRHYDLGSGNLVFSSTQRQLAGIQYVREQITQIWLNNRFKAVQSAVNRMFPQMQNMYVSSDDRERRFLYRCSSSSEPGKYILLDLDSHQCRTVTKEMPWLKVPLAASTCVSFTTRDGEQLEGYLTLPPGADADHRVPLVILPHGGPAYRDRGDFDPEVQFLATRGYAVYQPNYRGSSGYAPEISLNPRYDYRRMHDDVTDATKSLMQHPAVDPERVAIMGTSFGGYLSLCGVAFEPSLYRCAITSCGVFAWEAFVKDRRNNGRPAEYERLLDKLGHPGSDRARFDAISPLNHLENVHVPVFIAHGEKDMIANVVQSKRLVAALKQRGVPYETFFRPLEGHGFYDDKNRIEYYRRVEAFLAEHLAAPSR